MFNQINQIIQNLISHEIFHSEKIQNRNVIPKSLCKKKKKNTLLLEFQATSPHPPSPPYTHMMETRKEGRQSSRVPEVTWAAPGDEVGAAAAATLAAAGAEESTETRHTGRTNAPPPPPDTRIRAVSTSMVD